MASRSRRSAGGDTGGINVTLIQLYPISRLKEELEARNLPTAGKKQELADRLEAAVTGTYTPDVPTPKQRGRKAIKKEIEAVEIKEEQEQDEEPATPKKTPKKRGRKSKEMEEKEEEAEPVATTSDPPVKKTPNVKIEVEDEPLPKKKKPRKSVEETPPPTLVAEKSIEVVPEFTEDVPLLSLLAGKKQIKVEEVDEEVEDDENGEKPTHSHGTRRAVAMKNPKPKIEPVVERRKFIEISASDVFDDDDSPDYVEPARSSPPRQENKERIRDEIQMKEKKRKSDVRPIKQELSSVPRKPPMPALWAQKVLELKKQQEAKTSLPSPTEQKPKAVDVKPKPKIPLPTASVASTSFVLDDILSTHERQALEKKRKQEQEELERKEAERRQREKMAEFRRKQAEDEAKRAEKMKNRPPKPVPEPKKVVELKPHPYARPQSAEDVEKKTEVKSTENKPVKRLPPPPPPPPIPGKSVSSNSSVDSPASSSSKSLGEAPLKQRLPPPPPPPPISKLTAQQLAENASKNEVRNEEEKEKPTVAVADSSEGEVDTTAVTMFAEVMLKALKGKQLQIAAPQDEEIEEYDPFADEKGDLDVSAYVPSAVGTRNNTMIDEEEDDYEEGPSDDEIVGEVEDEEEETDESESEPEETLSPSKNRAAAGTDGEMEKLLQNPRDLLLKASTVVFSNSEEVVDPEGPQYVQMPCSDDYEPEEEEKKTPEYHGEPVPDDDEIDFFALAAGIQTKKKKEIVIEEEKLPSDESIEPDYYNADLHIKGAADKNWIIEPENADGQALMWGGVRSTYGIRLPFRDVKKEDQDENEPPKKIVFQIKILEFMSTKHLPFEELDPHDVRVGFSLGSTPLDLGESPNSYCISSLGKKASNNFFADFASNSVFHLNDVITTCLDLEDGSISYWKNDQDLGVAFANISLPDGDAIFPHICIKNCRVAVNFGGFEGDDEDHPWTKNQKWRFMTDLGRGDLIRSRKSPDSKAECTVLMMVGLPGVGKTTWVREYLRDHPEENWTLINHETVLAAMKVNGVSRKRAHQGRWDMVMGLIGKSLQRCVLLAARRRKNYILDMTNTSRETRKKRLQLFEEFRRKCVILMPTDEVMADRQARQARQDGTALVPPEAMLEMKAVISLPSQEFEPFEDIYFIEPPVNRIQDCIDQINRYNEEARPWFQKKYKRRRSQMIGLGDGIQRDPLQPRKPIQPLTVLPQLKIAVVPLDDPSSAYLDPSNPGGPLSASSSHDSAPTSASALGFSVVEDRTPSNRQSVHISIDTTIPPPQITPGVKPLVRVTIQDIPATAVPAPFHRPGDAALGQPSTEDQVAELSEQELNQLRATVKAANPSGNPMMSEAIMRSRLKAMQLKKIEASRQSVSSPSTVGTPIQVLGASSRIPTIGTPISVEPAVSFSSTHSVSMSLPPPGLNAPYLVNPPPNSFSQQPLPPITSLSAASPSIPPPGLMTFNLPPPSMNAPPSNAMNGSYPPYSWSQNNGN